MDDLRDFEAASLKIPSLPAPFRAVSGWERQLYSPEVLSSMSRQEAGEKVAAKGARVTDSVSKKTDVVVAGAEPGLQTGQGSRSWEYG